MLLKKSKKTLKIIPQNDFNVEHASAVRKMLLEAFQDEIRKDVILVFDESQHIDHAGIKLITGLFHECSAQNLKLSLDVDSPQVKSTVQLAGLYQLIETRES